MKIVLKDIMAAVQEKGRYITKTTDICIEGDLITNVGEMPADFKADRIINGKNKLVIPGLINAHTHSYMALFRNYADDLPFSKWLFDRILPLEDKLCVEDSYYGSLFGIMEMLKTGTTCFADMYIHTEAAPKAVAEAGIRACLSRGLVGSGRDEGGQKRLNDAKAEMKNWGSNPLITFRLAPHAPYTCDMDYMRIVAEEAAELKVGINIHASESENEIATIKQSYGCTPIECIEKTGLFDLPTIAAHCVYLTDNDIDILKAKGVSVATNPVSNLKLANGFAPIKRLMQKGVNIALGTDGAASNNTLNMFKDMQFLALIHKGAEKDSELVSAEEALRMATVNGAEALSLKGITGSIAKGMKADLAILDIDKIQYYPRSNMIAALSYSTTGAEVETVIVDGKILLENNEFKTIDSEKVIYNINRIFERITK